MAYTISFPDGICRRMRAKTLDDAIKEARVVVVATLRDKANILDAETYRVVATVFATTTGTTTYTAKENK